MRTRYGSRRLVAMAALLSMCWATFAAAAEIRFVQPSGSDSNDGKAWAAGRAWRTLGHALEELNVAPTPFDEIWIAMGTNYKYHPDPSDIGISYEIHKKIKIYGGFKGPTSGSPFGELAITDRDFGAKTILSGDLGSAGHSNRIMEIDHRVDGLVLLDSLVFEDGGDPSTPLAAGAAIWASANDDNLGPLRITYCVFRRNTGLQNGGAILTQQYELQVSDTQFEENTVIGTPSSNGGIGTPGTPSFGAAIKHEQARMTMANCTFSSNVAKNANDAPVSVAGGAVNIAMNGWNTNIADCGFYANSAYAGGNTKGLGGAVWVERSSGGSEVAYLGNCVFVGNFAGESGGATFMSRGGVISSCTFSQNSATTDGGGAALFNDGATSVVFSVKNSVLWGNTSGGSTYEDQIFIDSSYSSVLNIQYNCVQGYTGGGTGNIWTDPLFVDAGSGDFRLQRCSPAIDRGLNALLPLDIADVDRDFSYSEVHPWDSDSTPRIKNTTLDMGAYEATPAICIGDINGDGFVNGADLGLLLGSWGNCTAAPCVGDLNCDGIANGADLGVLLGQWGSCELPEAELEGRTMFMSSGFYELTPEDLRQYLGVESVDQAIAMLSAMDFEAMRNLLESFFAGSGGYEY